MFKPKRLIAQLLQDLERDFDTVRHGVRRLRGAEHPFDIVPYLGFGVGNTLYLRGRVLEDKGITLIGDDASRWRNLVNTYKRFASDEVPHARLEATFQGVRHAFVADAKGYFRVALELPEPLTDGHWHQVRLRLLAPQRDEADGVENCAAVLVPPSRAEFGVISDMDDTVVMTDATKWLRVLGTVLFGNARTRLPFKGVAAFYSALQQGRTGDNHNPLFYVSSSPWNLYDLLIEFLKIEEIPLGPLILRNWRGSGNELIPSQHGEFKTREIETILATYPELPFILIGDSGQEDPEIYTEIAETHPGRIRGIYIRNVSSNAARTQEVKALSTRVIATGTLLVLADDTLVAARHAAEQGFIESAALPRIEARTKEDAALFEDHREGEATVFKAS